MSNLALRGGSGRPPVIHQDRQRLWLRLFSCSASLEKRIRVRLKDEFDTSLPSFGILAALSRVPEGLTMGELSTAVRVSNATVTGIVSELCADELVVREMSRDDRRVQLVTLTDKGRQRFVRIARVHAEWIEQAFAGLSDEEVGVLLKLLGSVRESINQNQI